MDAQEERKLSLLHQEHPLEGTKKSSSERGTEGDQQSL